MMNGLFSLGKMVRYLSMYEQQVEIIDGVCNHDYFNYIAEIYRGFMKNLENLINDLTKYEAKAKDELRVIYDMSLAVFFSVIDNKKTQLSDMSKEQAKQLVEWLERYPMPLYEEMEHYEKCKKLKNLIEKIKNMDIIAK